MRLSLIREANIERLQHSPRTCIPDPKLRAMVLKAQIGTIGSLAEMSQRLPDQFSPAADLIGVEVFEALGEAMISLDHLARCLGVDLSAATAERFNRTSERLGAPVFIGIDWAKPGSEMTVTHEINSTEGA